LLKEAENWAAQHGGFTTHDPGKNERVTYSASEALALRANEAISFLHKQKADVDRLLGLLAALDTKKCELIATAYAAWNDLLIEGKTPNDKDIIHEIRRNWHKTKEAIPDARWFWALRWLTHNQIVPNGRGRAVEHTSKE
jgi:type I restriction enzyme S subunit